MNKKLLLGVLGAILITSGLVVYVKIANVGVSKQGAESKVLGAPQDKTEIEAEITVSGKKYKAILLKVEKSQKISLVSNLEEGKTGSEIYESGECTQIVSGGFYTKDNKPTGLFISEGEELGKFISSTLFNAVYSINDFETPRITRAQPKDHLRVGLQAGPMLIENGFTQLLNLKNDEEARRVVVATTGTNQTLFLVIYDPESIAMGPKLEDLADALDKLGQDLDLGLADAMNLDGGSASFFYSKTHKFPEITKAGSYFCITH